jgi:hypothetical protein
MVILLGTSVQFVNGRTQLVLELVDLIFGPLYLLAVLTALQAQRVNLFGEEIDLVGLLVRELVVRALNN